MSARGKQVVVLAGGLGTRMRPRTLTEPKFLIDVAARPFGEWLLERLARCGYRRALLCVGHLGDQICKALGDEHAGVAIDYASDGPELLGTAGALRRAVDRLDPTFLVTYGDSYLPFDYAAPLADLDAHPEALGTMSVHRNENQWDKSNTIVDGDRVVAYDKRAGSSDPRFDAIDYGAMALRREVIEALPLKPLGLDAVQSELASRGKLRAFVVGERFYEIGSEQGLADLESFLRR